MPTSPSSSHHQANGHRRLLVALFVVYLALLTWVVLWKLDVPRVGWGSGHLKLVPFVAADGYAASAPREVLANAALFLPFGAYLRLLGARAPHVVLGAAATSGTLEVAQYVLAIGSTDTTDVIANTAGAVVGAMLAAASLAAMGAHVGRRALTRMGTVGTVGALAACGLFAVGPLHYGAPDVRCDGQGWCHMGQDLSP